MRRGDKVFKVPKDYKENKDDRDDRDNVASLNSLTRQNRALAHYTLHITPYTKNTHALAYVKKNHYLCSRLGYYTNSRLLILQPTDYYFLQP